MGRVVSLLSIFCLLASVSYAEKDKDKDKVPYERTAEYLRIQYREANELARQAAKSEILRARGIEAANAAIERDLLALDKLERELAGNKLGDAERTKKEKEAEDLRDALKKKHAEYEKDVMKMVGDLKLAEKAETKDTVARLKEALKRLNDPPALGVDAALEREIHDLLGTFLDKDGRPTATYDLVGRAINEYLTRFADPKSTRGSPAARMEFVKKIRSLFEGLRPGGERTLVTQSQDVDALVHGDKVVSTSSATPPMSEADKATVNEAVMNAIRYGDAEYLDHVVNAFMSKEGATKKTSLAAIGALLGKHKKAVNEIAKSRGSGVDRDKLHDEAAKLVGEWVRGEKEEPGAGKKERVTKEQFARFCKLKCPGSVELGCPRG